MAQRYTSAKAMQDLNTWVLLAPAIIFFVGYQIYPIIRVVWISFTDYEFLTNEPANWVGVDNYIEAFNDPLMWTSLWRAALFTMMFLPGTIIFPLLLAILVDRVREPGLATFYRVVLLIPAIIPSTLVFVLWKWMYNYQVGPINFLLVEVLEIFTFHNAPQWLGGTPLTLPSIAIMEIWWGLGYHAIFFLAGLAVIPKDLNEAARLDGANEWQLFWHVTLPRLAPIIFPLLLAILVDRVREPGLATFYRVVLLIPAIIPSTLVFVLWKWMYNYQVGPINFLLVEVLEIFTFHNAPQWLGGTPLTLPSIAIMEIWWGLGYHAIFFLAGLAVIPKDLNEAARLDGANEWQLFWHVTLPRLAPIMMILVVLRFGTSMAVIDEYLIFGGFNRASPTYTWTVFMYDQAFKIGLWRQGFAAAIGMIGSVVMMFFVIILIYIFKPRD